MIYVANIADRRYEIVIDNAFTEVKLNGKPVDVNLKQLHDTNLYSLLLDNEKFEFFLDRSNGGYEIWHSSEQIHVDIYDEKTERLRKLMGNSSTSTGLSVLKAPMPGLVIKVEVEVGQQVKKGDGLLIVEAMKMENELKAHAPATIKEIRVSPRQPIEKNQILIVFE